MSILGVWCACSVDMIIDFELWKDYAYRSKILRISPSRAIDGMSGVNITDIIDCIIMGPIILYT